MAENTNLSWKRFSVTALRIPRNILIINSTFRFKGMNGLSLKTLFQAQFHNPSFIFFFICRLMMKIAICNDDDFQSKSKVLISS